MDDALERESRPQLSNRSGRQRGSRRGCRTAWTFPCGSSCFAATVPAAIPAAIETAVETAVSPNLKASGLQASPFAPVHLEAVGLETEPVTP